MNKIFAVWGGAVHGRRCSWLLSWTRIWWQPSLMLKNAGDWALVREPIGMLGNGLGTCQAGPGSFVWLGFRLVWSSESISWRCEGSLVVLARWLIDHSSIDWLVNRMCVRAVSRRGPSCLIVVRYQAENDPDAATACRDNVSILARALSGSLGGEE